MRKPKIGDILHYTTNNGNTYPAIVSIYHPIYLDTQVYLHVFFPEKIQYKRDVDYCQATHINHWSWPEEEKQSYIKSFSCKNCGNTLKLDNEMLYVCCFKCDWISTSSGTLHKKIGEKPKECEHDYVLMSLPDYTEINWYCKKCHVKQEKQLSGNSGTLDKADELIDKVWQVATIKGNPSPENELAYIRNLIKEYKGIK